MRPGEANDYTGLYEGLYEGVSVKLSGTGVHFVVVACRARALQWCVFLRVVGASVI